MAFIVPEVEVDTYWTSLEDDPYHVILFYHDHGTCEQFHSEIKSDMDLKRLPSEHSSTFLRIKCFPIWTGAERWCGIS
jgi:hypothetical protein